MCPFFSPPSQMPALQAMMFFTPRHVVLGILGGQIFYANNDGGFNRVFQEMIRDQNIDIRFNFEVRVSRRDNQIEISSGK